MAKKQSNPNITLVGEYYIPEKTSDVFREVVFVYQAQEWKGALPKFLEKQGLDLTDEEFDDSLVDNYQRLHPDNRKAWIVDSDARWPDKSLATYKVLAALYSGEWECRVCGPVPNVNPQPAARLRDLKKRGYVIGSQRRRCVACGKKQMHDILVMLPSIETRFEHGNELRKPISDTLKTRIKRVLRYREVCFSVDRSEVELLIDHKFPSQRWIQPETDNPNNMSESEIKRKFQLLNNQTNMLKSRYCDNCMKTGKRGVFMGIRWYYHGDEDWAGSTAYDEDGCIGCPWYDLERWKAELLSALGA
jgi:hypothetical protein